jgi:hypothetical protein
MQRDSRLATNTWRKHQSSARLLCTAGLLVVMGAGCDSRESDAIACIPHAELNLSERIDFDSAARIEIMADSDTFACTFEELSLK